MRTFRPRSIRRCSRSVSCKSVYGREADDVRDYVIHPIALVLRNQVIYLVCVFAGFDDIRQLAMQRIHSAEILEQLVAKPAGFALDDLHCPRSLRARLRG